MMKRVFKGRIIPLIILFAMVILPQFHMNTTGYGGGGNIQDVLSLVFLVLAILYLVIFSVLAGQFYQYEKLVKGDSNGFRLKYVGIFALIMVLLIGIGTFFWLSNRSVYEKKYCENRYFCSHSCYVGNESYRYLVSERDGGMESVFAIRNVLFAVS